MSSDKAMKWTDEQVVIAECRDQVLVVEAGAGCAKTSTLELYAERNSSERMLYLAFNRSVKEEGEKRFPKNVQCKTTHGVAYSQFGVQFSKGSKLGTPRPTEVQRFFQGITVSGAGLLLGTVSSFCNSAAPFIDEEHALSAMSGRDSYTVGQVVDGARALWDMMQDMGNSAAKMPHDGYLKLFQLSKPRLSYGVILLDEAQDANPVTLDIIGQQGRSKRVYVGDSHQAIYGFRGAVDALSSFDEATRMRLTGSFRFGSGIAGLSSAILLDWGRSEFPLQGLGQYETVFSVDRSKTHAFICRRNATIFDSAIMAARSRRPYGFVGGIEGYRFDMILDVYHLMSGEISSIRDGYIRSFGRFDEIVRYAEEMDDGELKAVIKVIQEYGSEIPSLIDMVKSNAVHFGAVSTVHASILNSGMIFFSTVHKAKGLEWMDIVLGDDFVKLELKPQKEGPPKYPDKEEINILYVAMTRAKRGLDLPVQVKDWLNETGQWHLTHSKPQERTEAAPMAAQEIVAHPSAERPVGRFQESQEAKGRREAAGWSKEVKIIETRPLREVSHEARMARVEEAANVLFSTLSEVETEFREHLVQHADKLASTADLMAEWFESKASEYRKISKSEKEAQP